MLDSRPGVAPHMKHDRIGQLLSYAKGRRHYLAIGIALSLLVHALILIFSPNYVRKKPTERIPVTYTIKKKAKKLPQ